MSIMDETPEASRLVELRRYPDGRTDVEVLIGESRVGTQGLAATQRLQQQGTGEWRFADGWEIRHIPSGLIVPVLALGEPMGLGHARDVLALLHGLADWTQPRQELAAISEDQQFRQITERVKAAVGQSRPVREQGSWEQLPKIQVWTIYDPAADDVVESGFDSYHDASEEMQQIQDRGEDLQGCEILCDEVEPWVLRCCARSCRTRLADDEQVAHPDPDGVVGIAAGDGWRRIDAHHWLCRRCSLLFVAGER